MNHKETLKTIRMGEGLQTEFKRQMPKLTRLAKTFSAFSNSSGGRVLIGVEDDGRIAALANPKGTLDLAQQVAGFYCNPPIEITADMLEMNPGETILVIQVPESGLKPILAVDFNHPKDAWPYFRSDKENLPMDKKSLRTMRRTESADLVQNFDELGRHEQKIIEALQSKPRQTAYELSRSCNIGVQRARKILVVLEQNGWVHAFFNEKRREYSLVVPWKGK